VNRTEVIQFFFDLIGGTVVALAIVGYLGKVLIAQMLKREELKLKASLRQAADMELERIRAVNQVARVEHEIMLSRLQDRRAQVIGSLFSKLVEARDKTSEYFIDSSPDRNGVTNERAIAAWKAIWSAINYFERRSVWLPKTCCDQVQEVIQLMRLVQTTRRAFGYDRHGPPAYTEKQNAAMMAAFEQVEKHVPEALQALAQEMRSLVDPCLKDEPAAAR
jgi:hypothetical protein